VEPTGPGRSGPTSSTSVFLNRVHVGVTLEDLRDMILEERPELSAFRARLGMSLVAEPGQREVQLSMGEGGAHAKCTLRSLGVARGSAFKVWVLTSGEAEAAAAGAAAAAAAAGWEASFANY